VTSCHGEQGRGFRSRTPLERVHLVAVGDFGDSTSTSSRSHSPRPSLRFVAANGHRLEAIAL
jgi:hypothetical protein